MNTRRIIARAAATAERVHIARDAPAAPTVRAGSILDAVLMPWGAVADVTDDGRTTYSEMWEPGSLAHDGPVPVYGSHVQTARGLERGPLIGVARDLTIEADGLHGSIHLATDEGRRLHELAALGVRAAVSIEADTDGDMTADDDRCRCPHRRPPGDLDRCGDRSSRHNRPPTPARWSPRYAPPRRRRPPPTTTRTSSSTRTATRYAVTLTATSSPRTAGRHRATRPGGRRSPKWSAVRWPATGCNDPPRRAAHPLARFTNAVDMLIAARQAPAAEQAQISRAFHDAYQQHREISRAMVNQITTDNPGVMPPTWLSTIFGIVDSGRPGITAMGGPASAGDTGMDIYWPYTTADLTTLVAEQLLQKTDIQSVKVSFLRGAATLKTYAGGSDVSYQLQRRSSPSYMAAYNRLLQTSYGLVTEITFDAALVAGAGATVVYDPSVADADGSKAKAFLFAASAKVKKATGTPATAVLVSSDVYAHWGGQPWLQPPMYGTQNVPGTAAASTLRINISGLEITEAVGMAAGNIVVSNDQAAAWFEDGPFLVTAEDVTKLGTDAAIWGMGITGLTVPTGVVKASPTAAAADAFEKAQAKAAKNDD